MLRVTATLTIGMTMAFSLKLKGKNLFHSALLPNLAYSSNAFRLNLSYSSPIQNHWYVLVSADALSTQASCRRDRRPGRLLSEASLATAPDRWRVSARLKMTIARGTYVESVFEPATLLLVMHFAIIIHTIHSHASHYC